MGYYIEVPQNLRKARQLIELYNARPEHEPFFDPSGERVGICVVQNGMFDAAGIAFSQDECDVFGQPSERDFRPRTWLSLPRETVLKLNPNVEHVLPPLSAVKSA